MRIAFIVSILVVLALVLLGVTLLEGVVFHGSRDQKVVALTFDDGPDQYNTPRILDILKQHNVTATFFVIGRNIEGNEELLKRASDEGNEVGIHSYNHSLLFLKGYGEVYEDLKRNKNLVEAITGKPVQSFRMPYGIPSWNINKVAKDLRMRVVFWDVNPRDFKDPGEEVIVEKIVASVKGGSIIVLHDTNGVRRDQTIEALDEIIVELKKRRYRFGKVEEIV